jgi:LDH2 family malate/lactate/ureidoglycolate dehydrogenase
MVDILSGVLTGGNHAGRVKDPFDDFSGPQNIGHLFILLKQIYFKKIIIKELKIILKQLKNFLRLKV